MKLNNKKTGIACMIGVAVLASSCSDWLDPKPLSFYTPEISFTDYNGLKTGTDMLNRDVRYFDIPQEALWTLVSFPNISFRI